MYRNMKKRSMLRIKQQYYNLNKMKSIQSSYFALSHLLKNNAYISFKQLNIKLIVSFPNRKSYP